MCKSTLNPCIINFLDETQLFVKIATLYSINKALNYMFMLNYVKQIDIRPERWLSLIEGAGYFANHECESYTECSLNKPIFSRTEVWSGQTISWLSLAGTRRAMERDKIGVLLTTRHYPSYRGGQFWAGPGRQFRRVWGVSSLSPLPSSPSPPRPVTPCALPKLACAPCALI